MPMMTLKELRMYHWKEMLSNRHGMNAVEKRHPDNYHHVLMWQKFNRAWSLHMGAVQALNGVVEGTAEQDCANAERTEVSSRGNR